MARSNKVALVAALKDKFSTSKAIVITEYVGLTVAQLMRLRRLLGKNAQYSVAKNTLAKIAAKRVGIVNLEASFTGSTAIAFVTGDDPVLSVKILRDFAKENSSLIFKGGFFEGKLLSANDIEKLADLDSREVLLKKLAGVMKSKQSQTLSLFNGLPSKLIYAVDNFRIKQSE